MTTTDTDVSDLGYEQARDELASIVGQLESGGTSLEESMRLWERGEALATHCERWLDRAQTRIDALTAERDGAGEDDEADDSEAADNPDED